MRKNNMIELLKCPLCQSEELEYDTVNGTHAYICPVCPFVGFEYYNKTDLVNLKTIIK